ncbi:MAG: tRNA preQ1(34) S-adenosylmethionine ribosyltransferase-isomerase QueA [Armatimonadota bacterium]
MQLQDFNYDLPEELIAQEPLAERDQSRLLVLNKKTGLIEHKKFLDLAGYLEPDDLLVLNDTRVVASRLHGRKESGGAVEALLLSKLDERHWQAMVKPGRRVPVGTEIIFGEGELTARAIDRLDDGGRILEFSCAGNCDDLISTLGETPLPPYIHRKLEDRERYQTIYSESEGSAAAPTAGLHFTPRVFEEIRAKGIETAFVTLHVGIGTFRPVRVENIMEHEMHAESVFINEATAEKINNCKGRIICVGTTTARALESAAVEKHRIKPMCDETRLFITPGYDIKIIDALVTNFHMPRSTLLILISAFAGRDKIMKAYHEAIEKKYRMLSFGDAMLII